MPSDGVQEAVARIFRIELDLDVDHDVDVIEGGQLDSVAFVQLLVALEERFGVTVDVAELDLDDFSTVRRVAAFVEKRDVAAATGG